MLSCGNDLLPCANDLRSCGNDLLTLVNDSVSHSNELLTCGNELLTCCHNFLSRGNEIKNAKKAVICPFLGSVHWLIFFSVIYLQMLGKSALLPKRPLQTLSPIKKKTA